MTTLGWIVIVFAIALVAMLLGYLAGKEVKERR